MIKYSKWTKRGLQHVSHTCNFGHNATSSTGHLFKLLTGRHHPSLRELEMDSYGRPPEKEKA